jgi:hypothetical protein
MEDDVWAAAQARTSAAEREPGMTPIRRATLRVMRPVMIAAIEAALKDKTRLPHGRLGQLLQAIEPHTLATIALEAITPQIGRRHRRKYKLALGIKIAAGEIFYANVSMAQEAAGVRGNKAALKHLRWRKLVLRGRLKAGRSESVRGWLGRLRREREIVWRALTKDTSQEEYVRAGSWLLARAVAANIVVLQGRLLAPAPQFDDRLERLQYIIERQNVRLRPSADKPSHWTGPETCHSGLKVKLLNHYNGNHQASIAASFANPRFNNERLGHLAAVDTLGDVALSVDKWTCDLVRLYAVDAGEHKDDDSRRARKQEIARTLATAEAMLRRGVFHNKYRVDSRGRLNALESFNYATADTQRSLFRFAAPVEITDKGLDWLRIHCANCYGHDKLSYQERIYWVLEHEQQIEDVFYEPYGSKDFWYSAKHPFAFAAACRELVLADNNPKYPSNLPLAFDHTASGLQHLALTGLDARTAALVNLINSERPTDVYSELARHTALQFDNSDPSVPWQWFFDKHGDRVRELLKTPGMTFSYAVTTEGNIRQVYEALYDILVEVCRCPACFTWQNVAYLVGCFRAACARELPGPVGTMEYIQSLVRECNKAGRFLGWTTLSGLRVSNDYPRPNTSMVYLPDGTEYDIADGFIGGTINKRKAVSSVTANFVHSLDATHLVRTVNALAANEMAALCLHDCFAPPAGHAEQFHITNRQELWAMYYEMGERGGPLAILREQNGNIGAEPPPPGDYDLSKVQSATYACC